jgi:hypothetical protein
MAVVRSSGSRGLACRCGCHTATMTAAHLISSALFCAVVGALIHGERGWRADLFIVGPLLLFEMACAKMGFDRSGVRGAIDGAGFGSIAAGWPALLLAITLFGKRSRAAAITMIVVYIQWFGVFALFGQWREAALAALGVGMTWLATRLLRPEVDRWMHNHLPGPTAVVATV